MGADLIIRSLNLLIRECEINLKSQISSQNVSFYLIIEYLRCKILGRTMNNEALVY